MKTESFFGWIYQNTTDRLATRVSKAFQQIGSGSVLQRVKIWASAPKVQMGAWIFLILGFIGYMASLVTSFVPASYALAHELLVYVCFFIIAIHKREWGLALFAFYLPLLTYRPLLMMLLLLLMFMLIDGVSKERVKEVLTNKMNLGIGFFMLVVLLTSIASAGWEISLKNYGLYYLSSLLLYFLILMQVDSKRVLKVVLLGLVIGGLMISIVAIFQYAILDYTDAKWVDAKSNPLLTKRVAGTFGNPNIFGQYLVLVAPIAFILMWFARSWRYRIYLGGVFLNIVLALVLTFSRGAWAALFIGGVLLAFMLERRLILLGLIAGAIGINFLPDVIMDRLVSIFNTRDTSSLYRFDAWKSAFAMIRDYWMTGIGMDDRTFLRVYPDYMMIDVRVYHFHNIFLQHFVMGGILGIMSVLFLFYQGFRMLVERIFTFKGKDGFLHGVSIGVFASLTAITIAALTDDIWRHYAVSFTFWTLFALIGVLYRLGKKGVLQDER